MRTQGRRVAAVFLVAGALLCVASVYRASLLGSDSTFIPSPVETGFLTLASDWGHPELRCKILTAAAVDSIDPSAWTSWEDAFEDFKDAPRSRALFRIHTSLWASNDLGEAQVVFDMVLTLVGWRVERVRPGH